MLADARLCERIARAHSRTFHLASHFLPAGKRRGAFALYSFCRLADDIVDESTPSTARARLATFARALGEAYAGRPSEPVFRELAWTVREFGVPREPFEELLAGVGRDLEGTTYPGWGELAAYCEGVASSVGEMCTHVFGVQAGAGSLDRAVGYARTLGTAMQLTNILRDVGEDARRSRCYLPDEELAACDLTRAEVLDGSAMHRRDEWSEFMRLQVARARERYAAAAPGIALLHRDAQRCASACSVGYAGILGVIERNGFDSFSRRASLGWPARVRVLAHCWLGPHPSRLVASVDALPTAGGRAPESRAATPESKRRGVGAATPSLAPDDGATAATPA